MPDSIAVIIPTFNTPEYIEECLCSIVTQVITTPGVTVEIFLGIDACSASLAQAELIFSKFQNISIFYFDKNLGPKNH
jgi:GT2 family glycosyltransferase